MWLWAQGTEVEWGGVTGGWGGEGEVWERDEGREIKTKDNQLKKVMVVGFSEPGCPAAIPQQRIWRTGGGSRLGTVSSGRSFHRRMADCRCHLVACRWLLLNWGRTKDWQHWIHGLIGCQIGLCGVWVWLSRRWTFLWPLPSWRKVRKHEALRSQTPLTLKLLAMLMLFSSKSSPKEMLTRPEMFVLRAQLRLRMYQTLDRS